MGLLQQRKNQQHSKATATNTSKTNHSLSPPQQQQQQPRLKQKHHHHRCKKLILSFLCCFMIFVIVVSVVQFVPWISTRLMLLQQKQKWLLEYYYYYYHPKEKSVCDEQSLTLLVPTTSTNTFKFRVLEFPSIINDNYSNKNTVKTIDKKKKNNKNTDKNHNVVYSSTLRNEHEKEKNRENDDNIQFYFNSIPIYNQQINKKKLISLLSNVTAHRQNNNKFLSSTRCVHHHHHQKSNSLSSDNDHNNNNSNNNTSNDSNDNNSWISRSCHYTNYELCYDTVQQDYVRLFFTTANKNNNNGNTLGVDIDNVYNPYVSIGTINPRWNIKPPITTQQQQQKTKTNNRERKKTTSKRMMMENSREVNIYLSDRGVYKMKWKPRIVVIDVADDVNDKSNNNNNANSHDKENDDSIYYLPHNVLLVPFHSMAGHNVGHLLWDDLYPIYTVCKLFGYNLYDMIERKNEQQQVLFQLLLIRSKLVTTTTKMNSTTTTTTKEQIPLYANCDKQRNKRIGCQTNFIKWLPSIGIKNPILSFSTTTTINITSSTSSNASTVSSSSKNGNSAAVRYVCAKNSVAGIGLLNDHGWYDHGWDYEPYSNSKSNSNSNIDATTIATTDSHRSIVSKDNNNINHLLQSISGQIDDSNASPSTSIGTWHHHNNGRGYQFYRFCQLLMENIMKNNIQDTDYYNKDDTTTVSGYTNEDTRHQTTTTTTTRIMKSSKSNNFTPQITFSINSSRDWSRRSNFSNYISILQEQLDRKQYPIHIQQYEFRTLSLFEQVQIMNNTTLFISMNGGGTIPSMFLQRNCVFIIFYSINSGYDFTTLSTPNNSYPVRLDYDLFTNTPHLRVHWIPLLPNDLSDESSNYLSRHLSSSSSSSTTTTSNSNEAHYEMFVRLIQHEVATIIRRNKQQ